MLWDLIAVLVLNSFSLTTTRNDVPSCLVAAGDDRWLVLSWCHDELDLVSISVLFVYALYIEYCLVTHVLSID